MKMTRREAVGVLAGVIPALHGSASFAAQTGPQAQIMSGPFQPTSKSLSAYQVPDWFRDAKFGIWAHWTAQCVPEQGDWYARSMYIEGNKDYKFHVAHYGHPSKFGFKDMKNAEASDQYYEELCRMVRDINSRYLRARFPELSADQAERSLLDLERSRGAFRGVRFEDLLHVPDKRFFRRKGLHAFEMVGVEGEAFTDADEYLRYLAKHLNDGYVASRDMRNYADALRSVGAGEISRDEAVKRMPKLKRVGGTCPCSKGVRWVMEDANGDARPPVHGRN